MITIDDIVHVDISRDEFNECIESAKSVLQHLMDRANLHERDDLERFINILMGEVAESMVIAWLNEHKRFNRRDADKSAGVPDAGHDLVLRSTQNAEIRCSIKSSLAYKLNLESILNQSKLATTSSELREVNIQVYFWLSLNPPRGQPRVTVPTIRQSVIIGWFGNHDINTFTTYNREQRQAPDTTLRNARPMGDLLKFIL